MTKPFTPQAGAHSIRFTGNGTSAAYALPTKTDAGPCTLLIVNESGSADAWVAVGGSAVAAAIPTSTPAAGMIVKFGQSVVIGVGQGDTHIAVITGGGGVPMTCTLGQGGV